MPTIERAPTPTGLWFDRWSLRDGTRLALRALCPQDAAGLGAIVRDTIGRGGSVLIAALASVWFVQRAFNLGV